MTIETRITRLETAIHELVESGHTVDKFAMVLFPAVNSIWQEIYNEQEEYKRLKEKYGEK